MKKKIGVLMLVSTILLGNVFAQTIPAGKELFVAVWQFAEKNNITEIEKFKRSLNDFAMKQTLRDTKVDLKTGNRTTNKSVDFEIDNSFDIDADQYRFKTYQIEKAMGKNTIRIFDWTASNNGGKIVVKLNSSITAPCDKDGKPSNDWTVAKILNTSKIESMAANDLAAYLNIDNAKYEEALTSVLLNPNFLTEALPEMTDLGMDFFVEKYNLKERKGNISVKIDDAGRNQDTKYEYNYRATAHIGSGGITNKKQSSIKIYGNSNDFAKAKKDSVSSFTVRIADVGKNFDGSLALSFIAD